MSDVVFGIEVSHLLASVISSVVGDNGVGDPKATYYALPEELDNLLPADLEDRHCLDPFGEVVDGY